MSNFPDNFSLRAYTASQERPIIAIEPPLYAATPADVAAMTKARAGLVASLDVLRANAWDYDSTEIPPYAWLVADAQAFIEQMDKAIAQARASVEAWS